MSTILHDIHDVPLVRHFDRNIHEKYFDLILYRYSGHSLHFRIEAPLISREVLPETYFLSVIIAADAQAGPFLQFQASCLCGTL